MDRIPHRLFAGGALAAGAVTLGLATSGVAGVDEDLAAATRPAPQVQERLVAYDDCPRLRPSAPLGQEL